MKQFGDRNFGRTALLLLFTFMLANTVSYAQSGSWEPAQNPLMTRWADNVNPQNVHSKYPRPQMVRKQWKNLNGLWKYAISPALDKKPKKWTGNILVPFGIESALSGVKKEVDPDHRLWYQRTFSVPDDWQGKRLLLHFGAVDWKTTVWVNGKKMGVHEGGYNSFTYDVTEAFNKNGEQQITVAVWDPTDKGFQPHGKQTLDPRGIWYTSTTGIWQTVWLEPVPEVAIANLKMTPDIDQSYLHLRVDGSSNAPGYTVRATAYDGSNSINTQSGNLGEELNLSIPNTKLWSPDHPFLYDLTVSLYHNGEKVDEVKSYFGMREIRLGQGSDGYTRLFLNDKPLFQFGLLDQGFWPDGVYTAPTDAAMKYDLQVTKDLGFNMIRKHVKVEPNRWYYYADKMGLLVWQDMPSGDKHIRRGEKDIKRVAQSAHDFKKELKVMVNEHYNHPSIVTWVPFNEGWGQFNTAQIADFVKGLDNSRLVDCPSGWQDRGVGDMHDIHSYPGPDMPKPAKGRAAILGEFGGQALVVKGHLWISDFSKAPSHYKTSQSEDKLHNKYDNLIKALMPLKENGLAGAVYTQTTDVESEVNGMMTYDRAVVKFDEEHLHKLHQKLINE